MADGVGSAAIGAEAYLEIRTEGGEPLAQTTARALGLVAEARTRVVSTSASETLVSFVLAESTAIVRADAILLLTCAGARLDRAYLAAARDRSTRAIRYVRFAGTNRPAARAAAVREARALVREPGAVVDVDDARRVMVSRGDGFARALHLRASGFDDAFAERLRRDAPSAIDALFEDAGLTPDRGHDHVFAPVGYSRNAFVGERAIAAHVSPEAPSPEVTLLLVGFDLEAEARVARALGRWSGGAVEPVTLAPGRSRC